MVGEGAALGVPGAVLAVALTVGVITALLLWLLLAEAVEEALGAALALPPPLALSQAVLVAVGDSDALTVPVTLPSAVTICVPLPTPVPLTLGLGDTLAVALPLARVERMSVTVAEPVTLTGCKAEALPLSAQLRELLGLAE